MVLDTSAILAILLQEPDEPRLKRRILASSRLKIGAPTLLEASMVIGSRQGPSGPQKVERFLRDLQVEVVPFTAEHAAAAHDAFLRYGKGRHPAALNFGDCMAYAVAKVGGMPLLFVGNDFAQTDLPAA
jgi:ribonuclease VapC